VLESLVAGSLAYLFLRDSVPRCFVKYFASLAALFDQLSTILAVSAGAFETNPFVRLFLTSPALFFVFSIAKILFAFYIGSTRPRLGIWIALVFLAAAIINTGNIYLLNT